MDFLLDVIDPNNNYIGPLIFASILLIGTTVGLINGFKTALFFLCLNIISIVATILVLSYREEIVDKLIPGNFKIGKFKIKDLLSDGLEKTVKNNPELKIPADFASKNKGIVGIYNTFTIIIPLMIYIFLNTFIFMPIYYVFRKRLKGDAFKDKFAGKGVVLSRVGGGAIGFLTSLPVAIILGAMAAAIGDVDSNFAKFISWLTEAISLGKVKNLPRSVKDLKLLIEYLIQK